MTDRPRRLLYDYNGPRIILDQLVGGLVLA